MVREGNGFRAAWRLASFVAAMFAVTSAGAPALAAAPIQAHVPAASNNAYDYYVQAAQLHSTLMKANPKAYAVDQVTDARDSRGLTHQQLAQRYPIGAKEAWVTKKAMVLKLLRQGFRYRYQAPPPDFTTMFPHLGQYRSLARLLLIESHCHSARAVWGAVRRQCIGYSSPGIGHSPWRHADRRTGWLCHRRHGPRRAMAPGAPPQRG